MAQRHREVQGVVTAVVASAVSSGCGCAQTLAIAEAAQAHAIGDAVP
jgi:hypothetical protein